MPALAPTTEPAIIFLSGYAEAHYRFRGDLIAQLVAEGWHVYALAPDYDAAKEARVIALGAIPMTISLERNGLSLVRDIRSLVALYRLFRRIRPAVFFGYFIKPVIYGAIAAWLARVPRRVVMVAGLGYVFIDADRGTSAKARVLKAVVNSLYWLAFRLSHRVIFQNPDDFELMVEGGIAPRNRAMRVDGSGVNLDRFPLRTTPRAAQQRLTFVWVGRLLREKGVVELVEATKIARGQGFDIEVLLVGGVDSNPGSLTESTVQGWHDAGIITWTGKVDDVRPYLEQSDVFVLPSYREGLPRSTQEAMAIGLAVITTDVPGCRETVVNGVNGTLVPVRSAPAIAEAMIRYAREPGLVAQHAAAGRALVERKFDVRVINCHMRAALIGPQPT